MSLQSWKDEFYEDFSEHKDSLYVKGGRNKETNSLALKMAELSLKKWRGLTPENLKKHGCLRIERGAIFFPDGVFGIDDLSCSLCYASVCCDHCPILYFRPVGCCNQYISFTAHKNPQPMIELLEGTVQKLKELCS